MKQNYGLKRIIAEIIDIIMGYTAHFIILVVIVAIFSAASFENRETLSEFSGDLVVATVVGIVLATLSVIGIQYFSLKRNAASIGYKFMGLKVVTENGVTLDSRSVLIRSVARVFYGASFLVILPGILHLAYVWDNVGHKSPLDMWMRTKVVLAK